MLSLELKKVLIVSLFLMFLFQGCNPTINSGQGTTHPQDSTKILTPTFLIETSTILTTTNTITPTNTPSNTVTPTITPPPTLIPDLREAEIIQLMQTNDNCSGFCFWGITPRDTTFDEAVNFLQKFKTTKLTKNELNEIQYADNLLYSEENVWITIEFTNIDEVVDDLRVVIGGLDYANVPQKNWEAFQIDSYLRKYGMPKSFQVILIEGPEGRFRYGLVILYDEGFLVYYGKQTAIHPEILHACPLAEHSIEQLEIKQETPNNNNTLKPAVEISKLTGFSREDFYNILTGNPEKACFDLDFDLYMSFQ
jgi:hypothetical protein